jgi:hypothetical protein
MPQSSFPPKANLASRLQGNWMDSKQGNGPPKPRCEILWQRLCGTGVVDSVLLVISLGHQRAPYCIYALQHYGVLQSWLLKSPFTCGTVYWYQPGRVAVHKNNTNRHSLVRRSLKQDTLQRRAGSSSVSLQGTGTTGEPTLRLQPMAGTNQKWGTYLRQHQSQQFWHTCRRFQTLGLRSRHTPLCRRNVWICQAKAEKS